MLNWPFNFRIPATTELLSVVSKWKAKDHFLDASSASSLQPLPPTFRHIDLKHGKTSQATVAYGIEAIVEDPSDVRLTKPHVKRNVQPIHISQRTPQYGIDVNDPQQRRGTSTQLTIKTLRLLPENQQSRSMAQKMSSMFSSSKLPRFAFEIDVPYPSVLQINHPAPILFVIAASPKTDPSSTTIQPSIHTFYRYPSAHVKHLKLWLEAHTGIRCPSLLSDSTDAPAGETLPDTTWIAGPNEDYDSEEDFEFSLQGSPSRETLPAYSELPGEASYTIDSAPTGSGTKR